VDSDTAHSVVGSYQSASNGERRLQFPGSLDIRPGWTLVFRIDEVKDGGVRKSKIEVETTFEWDAAQGSLLLFVGKGKTAPKWSKSVARCKSSARGSSLRKFIQRPQ
jgi:hypothetical protein